MSLLIQQTNEIAGGWEKEIDKASIRQTMEILQKSQYQFPTKSLIREITCNGIDSVRERDMALSILSGQTTIEDHFVEDDGRPETAASRFDPAYYDPKWLSDDPLVHIKYVEGKALDRDRLEIHDNGVGLGGNRLAKYFSLGWSTKRLNKKQLGKYGIGAKSPLSVMSYYTVESRYKGSLYRFNVYNANVESIIPQWNMTTGEENRFILFGNPDKPVKVYYELTDQKNGVIISVEAKKAHKPLYIDAVRSQLLYFDNVEMQVIAANGLTSNIDFKAHIFYENDQIILSDNDYWSRPHMLINNVNYGFIQFAELELEDKMGNIGIKVDPELISINPSRESVIWDDTTRAVVLDKFIRVVDTATALIQEELKDTDILKWYGVCSQITTRWGNSTSVIARLANVIDISGIKPKFSQDGIIKYSRDMFYLLDIFNVELQESAKGGIKKISVDRRFGSIDTSWSTPIFIKGGKTLNRKDKYLISLHKMFITIRTRDLVLDEPSEMASDEKKREIEKRNKLRIALAYWIEKSEMVKDYDAVDVPEDFHASELQEDEIIPETVEEIEEQKEVKLTYAQRRKATGKTLIYVPVVNRIQYIDDIRDPQDYVWSSHEVSISSINDWAGDVYYGVEEDRPMVEMAARITNKRTVSSKDDQEIVLICSSNNPTDDQETSLLTCARSNLKHYRGFKPIARFFMDIKNKNTVTMSNALIRWNTANQIRGKLGKLNFLYNFPFDGEKQTRYKALVQYAKDYYRDLTALGADELSGLLMHLQKVQDFQTLVLSQPDPEVLTQTAIDMWGSPNITDGHAVDMSVLQDLNDLVEWATPLQMLNEIPVLTGVMNPMVELHINAARHPYSISADLEFEIKEYLRFKLGSVVRVDLIALPGEAFSKQDMQNAIAEAPFTPYSGIEDDVHEPHPFGLVS